jgi:hypothetical protein
MDIMTLWLDGSISTIDGYGSSGNQKNSKAPSKKKGGAGPAAKKSAKSSGKKANATRLARKSLMSSMPSLSGTASPFPKMNYNF